MRRVLSIALAGVLAGAALPAGGALAHVTPPLVLVSDRDALIGLLSGAQKFFVREVRLTASEREAVRRGTGWSPDEDFYRFYLGRDVQGRLLSAVVFVTEYTVHGPVRVAVALGADGRVRGATVVELTEETYPWLKPLIDQDFTRDYVGQDARGKFALTERVTRVSTESMPRFYGQVVTSLMQRAAVLFETALLKRGEAT
jgi:hypothetical protein